MQVELRVGGGLYRKLTHMHLQREALDACGIKVMIEALAGPLGKGIGSKEEEGSSKQRTGHHVGSPVKVDRGAGFCPSYRIGRGKRADGFSPWI